MTRALVLACCLTGCLRDLGPPVGPPARVACIDVDSNPQVDVHFNSEILAPLLVDEYHCTRCHSATGTTPIGFADTGLDVSSYSTLVAGGTRSGTNIIVPGKPCESILVQKLGASPPFGARMPLDGPPYLDPDDIVLIKDWIAEGAADN